VERGTRIHMHTHIIWPASKTGRKDVNGDHGGREGGEMHSDSMREKWMKKNQLD